MRHAVEGGSGLILTPWDPRTKISTWEFLLFASIFKAVTVAEIEPASLDLSNFETAFLATTCYLKIAI